MNKVDLQDKESVASISESTTSRSITIAQSSTSAIVMPSSASPSVIAENSLSLDTSSTASVTLGPLKESDNNVALNNNGNFSIYIIN